MQLSKYLWKGGCESTELRTDGRCVDESTRFGLWVTVLKHGQTWWWLVRRRAGVARDSHLVLWLSPLSRPECKRTGMVLMWLCYKSADRTGKGATGAIIRYLLRSRPFTTLSKGLEEPKSASHSCLAFWFQGHTLLPAATAAAASLPAVDWRTRLQWLVSSCWTCLLAVLTVDRWQLQACDTHMPVTADLT